VSGWQAPSVFVPSYDLSQLGAGERQRCLGFHALRIMPLPILPSRSCSEKRKWGCASERGPAKPRSERGPLWRSSWQHSQHRRRPSEGERSARAQGTPQARMGGDGAGTEAGGSPRVHAPAPTLSRRAESPAACHVSARWRAERGGRELAHGRTIAISTWRALDSCGRACARRARAGGGFSVGSRSAALPQHRQRSSLHGREVAGSRYTGTAPRLVLGRS